MRYQVGDYVKLLKKEDYPEGYGEGSRCFDGRPGYNYIMKDIAAQEPIGKVFYVDCDEWLSIEFCDNSIGGERDFYWLPQWVQRIDGSSKGEF